jgi:hypothetical protein
MSRAGNPYDNAKAERFMRTLKDEEVAGKTYVSLEDARQRIAGESHLRFCVGNGAGFVFLNEMDSTRLRPVRGGGECFGSLC